MDSADADTTSSQSEYTILRIKRKRDDDVPEVLVVDKKGMKRRKSGMDIFQFAETIDEDAWKQIQQDELRDRISVLSKSLSKSGPKSPQSLGEDRVTSNPISRRSSSQTNGPARQYRVVSQNAQTRLSSRFSPMPPKVLSSKNLEKASSKLRIYDAELAPPEPLADVDQEMEKFQMLLKDYLKVDDTVPIATGDANKAVASTILPSLTSGDYVYDIFYHRPSTLSEQSIAANMATVTGLPPAFDEDDEYESESEVEDEADEDSNAEDFYRNDYPDDEETSESDNEGSDLYSEDDFEDHHRFEPEE